MMKCDKRDREQAIDDYLSGSLSAKETEAFEEHFFNCDECFQDLKLREEIVDIIKEEGEIVFAKYLRKHRFKDTSNLRSLVQKLPVFSHRRQSQRIYASLAAVAVAALVLILANPFASNDITDLYQIKPFPYIKPYTLGDVEEGKRTFFEAMDYYNLQQYESACEKLEEALRLNPQLKDGRFYLGVAYLFRNKLDNAIANLIRAVENNPNSEKVHWYLGHAYLKKGENVSAKKEFQTVTGFGGERYSRKAEALLSSLQTREAKEN